MKNKRSKFLNVSYTIDINKILTVPLSRKDQNNLDKINIIYNRLGCYRSYHYIIPDLYILFCKNSLSTSQLSKIYNISMRTIQIWIKELNLRDFNSPKINSTNNKEFDFEFNPKSNLNSNITNILQDYDFSNFDSLPESCSEFLNYLATIKGKSSNTVNAYRIDLIVFFRFIKLYKGLISPDIKSFEDISIHDIDINLISNITLSDMYAFLSFVEKKRFNNAHSRARKVATLKSFFKYLHTKAKTITSNPTLDLETPKLDKRHPIYLSLEESVILLNSLDKNTRNFSRDYCILTLFLNCGMRLSELCNIEINKIKSDTLSIIGKGNKERTVYLNNACINAINKYLKCRDDSKCKLEDKKFLFLSSQHKVINKRTVEILVKKHVFNAGLTNEKYTPHKLRHTAATLMYKHGEVDIRSLQAILGHENISTTQIYTHIDDDNLRNAINSNPLSKL